MRLHRTLGALLLGAGLIMAGDDLGGHGSRRGATYAVRHHPCTAFPRGRRQCRAHDGSLASADTWLRHTLAPVLASSDFTHERLVVVVTADEDGSRPQGRLRAVRRSGSGLWTKRPATGTG